MKREQPATSRNRGYDVADWTHTANRSGYSIRRAAALILATLWMTCGTASLACFAIAGRDTGSCPVFARAFPGHAPAHPSTQARSATQAMVFASIFSAIVDTLYRSHVNATVVHPRGVLRIESFTTGGEEYLGESGTLTRLVEGALPESARSLVDAYLAANAERAWLAQIWMPQAHGQLDVTRLFLDSSSVERFLNPPAADSATASVPLPGSVLGDMPAVLSLSKPGIADDSATALVFALLRTPRSPAPKRADVAALMILRAKGNRWSVWRELPVPLPLAR